MIEEKEKKKEEFFKIQNGDNTIVSCFEVQDVIKLLKALNYKELSISYHCGREFSTINSASFLINHM